MKHFFVLLALHFVCCAFAQKPDSLKFNNRKYKQEISVDFRGVLNFGNYNNNYYYNNNYNYYGYDNNNRYGTSLIWKVRNDRGKLIAASYSKNWRFQLQTSSFVSTDQVQRFESNGTTIEYIENGLKQLYFNPSFGFERVNFFNHFNFYYGADFGLAYSLERQGQNYRFAIGSGQIFEFTRNFDVFGPNATAFVGMKYRISERFSISVESAFFASFEWVNSRLYDQVQKQTVSKTKYKNFGHAFRPLRLLTFNYHFKQY